MPVPTPDPSDPIPVDFSALFRSRSPAPPTPATPATPIARHTDQCLRDYRRHGFCDHTVLRPVPSSTRARRARIRRIRAVLSWVACALVLACTYFIASRLGLLGVAATAGLGIGYILLLFCGVPAGLLSDLSRTLPPDARSRLAAPDKAKGRNVRRRPGPDTRSGS